MSRYIIRRVLLGLLLLIIVSALTFVLFRVFPTANPAVLRAGRDPQPKLIAEIERVLGLNKSLPVPQENPASKTGAYIRHCSMPNRLAKYRRPSQAPGSHG